MRGSDTEATTEVVMSVGDLRGRSIWSDGGERLGTVADVETDDDGRIVAFDVRERWMLGPHHTVLARGMRIDDGDVVVPAASALEMRTREVRARTDAAAATQRDDATALGAGAVPVFVAGRRGADRRYGGFSFPGSLFGGLVLVSSVLLVGGVLAAAAGTDPGVVDTSLDSFDAVTTGALAVVGATLLLASLLGGWAAGLASRFSGVGNGLAAVVWALGLGVAFGALGAWLGTEYDVYAGTDLPSFSTDGFAVWGSVAFAVALVLMLVGGALGGALGERWHRRVDRSMLDVLTIDGGADAAMGRVGSPVASQPPVDGDGTVLEGTEASTRRPHD